MRKSHLVVSLALVGSLAGIASASVPKKLGSSKPASLLDTKAALSEPLQQRLSSIRAQGSEGYRNLVQIMFDVDAPMDARWKSVTAAARVGGKEAKPELERALKSKEWFMRNAGLVAMTQLDPKSASVWARKLMSDKALVVRMAAVDTIRKTRDTSSLPLLWQKLEAKENFRGNQSLFIRRRIVEVLSSMEKNGQEGRFVALLKDSDSSLHPHAIAALERMTKQSFGKPSEPIQYKKAQWEKWWRDSRAM